MKTLVMALLSLLLAVGMIVTPSQAGLGEATFATSMGDTIESVDPTGLRVALLELAFAKSSIGGMVESVDPAGLTVTILTDFGKKESLPVTNESVLVGLTKGDRIFCEMNEDGKVTKISKATPLQNGSPAPEPKG